MMIDRHPALFRKLAIVWTLLILIACWLPGQTLPEPETIRLGFRFPQVDKLIHGSMFLGFGLLSMLAGRIDLRRVGVVGALGLLLAVLSEAGQALPWVHRDAGIADALADSVGLALGLAFALWLAGRPEKVVASHPQPADNRA